MSIGKQVRMWRQDHTGDTQAELAEAAGCCRETISAIECGRLTSSVDLLCRLADALGVSLDYLTERGIWHPGRDSEIDIGVVRACEVEPPKPE